MSFQLASYPCEGDRLTKKYNYSQAVKVGNIIRTSGQGGWDEEGNMNLEGTKVAIQAQIEKAFDNCMAAVNAIDPNVTWKNVYAVKSYHIDMVPSFDIVVERLKTLMPDHQPIWTCVQVKGLGIDGMAIEVEIEAAV